VRDPGFQAFYQGLGVLLGSEIQGSVCNLYGLEKTTDLGVGCGQHVEKTRVRAGRYFDRPLGEFDGLRTISDRRVRAGSQHPGRLVQ